MEKNYTPNDIKILYKDDEYVVVHKPAHLVVHPYKGRGAPKTKTSLMALTRDLLETKVFPIHRLDGPVSGPVLFALKGKHVKAVQDVWHVETTKKKYYALVKGVLPVAGEYKFALKEKGGFSKSAHTLFDPVRAYGDTTLVDIEIKTGRKHQIRRHFSRRQHNLIGDVKYGRGVINHYFKEQYGLDRIFLHCHTLDITLENGKRINVTSPLDKELQDCLKALEKRPFHLKDLPVTNLTLKTL